MGSPRGSLSSSFPAANDVSAGANPGPFGQPNPDPGPEFRRTFSQDFKDNIVWHVRRAYQIVQDRHEEGLGFDAHTFGYNVYRVGMFWLGKCCDRSGGKLARVQELKSLFRFRGGDYTLGCYKVGATAATNIWEAFPTSDNGGFTLNSEGQPFLVGLEDAMIDRVDDLRYVVVAHMGNPTDGLCAVYLCIPIQAEGGKIKRWGYAECIYNRGQGDSIAPPPPPPSGGPPPEDREVPIAPEEEPEADVVVTAR